MLPYLEQPHVFIGSLRIELFGIMVVWGILSMRQQLTRQAIYHRLDTAITNDMFFIGVCSFPLSHVFSVLWTDPSLILSDPLILLKVNQSIDSFGGFFSFTIGFFIYKWKYDVHAQYLSYLDCAAYAFCFGWIFCRMGCAFAHDHPSIPMTGLLSFNYPENMYGGVPRHNLGFDEALSMSVIFFILFCLNRSNRIKKMQGMLYITFLFLYGVFRFFLDFYRATDLHNIDVRYACLTPAQWGCMLMIIMGFYFIYKQNLWRAPASIAKTFPDITSEQQQFPPLKKIQ